MSKVTKVERSLESSTLIVSLDDGSTHLLTIGDPEGIDDVIKTDAESGQLAEYLDDIPDVFRDTAEDISEARGEAEDFAVIYEAA